MTNPAYLTSMFESDLSAMDRSGATAWTLDAGTPTYSDAQMHLDSTDAVSIVTVDHLDPAKGSVSFRYTRESDTGGAETLLECGVDGTGTDYLSLGVDASDHFVMTWTADGGSEQSVSSVQTIAPDTVYFISCAWQHTSMSVTVTDDMSTQTASGTRDVPQGDWGSGDLVLEAA